jgi:hypothetical protein
MGKGAAGLIRYCYYEEGSSQTKERAIRGELLYSNELFENYLSNGHLDIRTLAQQFHQVAALNEKTEKFVWHQTINFPPGEQVSNEVMVNIAKDFAQYFGFEQNQYLVFRHRDKPHDHFHLIANRIHASGANTATDQGNYERIQHFCRLMEKKWSMRVTPNHRQKIDAKHNRENLQLTRMKRVLDALIPKSKTIQELSTALKGRGIILHLGRGISFTDKQFGLTFKGSDLGREYSRAGIEKRLGKAEARDEKVERFDGLRRQALRNIIDGVIRETRTYSFTGGRVNKGEKDPAWRDFEERLKAKGVTLHLVQKENGDVRGVAFQLGARRFVNGRELGALYCHHVLPFRFGRSQEEFEKYYLMFKERQKKESERAEEKPFLEVGYTPEVEGTRMITSANNAYETSRDLAKIAESLRSGTPRKYRRRSG